MLGLGHQPGTGSLRSSSGVTLEMAAVTAGWDRQGEQDTLQAKSVLHTGEASKGAKDAPEEQGRRAWESHRAVLNCSGPFQGLWGPGSSTAHTVLVLHSYSAFELEAVCREGCALLQPVVFHEQQPVVVFKLYLLLMSLDLLQLAFT